LIEVVEKCRLDGDVETKRWVSCCKGERKRGKAVMIKAN
jgi:hypothetical protein